MNELNRNEQMVIGINPVVVSKDKTTASTKRQNIILINTSTGSQKITISIDEDATVNEGIVLSAGGSWSDNTESGYKATQKMISAICNEADGKLSIQERLIK